MRRKTVICREGVYYLVVVLIILIGSILREVNLLLLFASLLACPLYLSWRLARKVVSDLEIKRRMPGQIFAGDVFYVQFELFNLRKKLSAWAIVIEDTIRHSNSNHIELDPAKKTKQRKSRPLRPVVYFEHVPAGEFRKKSYAGRLPSRGRYIIGPKTISTRFPFGFFRCSITDTETTEFTVFPRLGTLSSVWRAKQHEADESVRRRKFRSSRSSGEFLGVRKWQQGDIRKWIHWRASAKHNQLVVRQFEQHQNRDVAILLDNYHSVEKCTLDIENIELAISFTATIINDISHRGGSNLTFATFRKKNVENGDSNMTEIRSGAISAPLLEGIFEMLAVLETETNDGIHDLLLETLINTDANTDILLISHAPIDFRSERFESLRNDPRFRALGQRIRIIDTSSSEFDDLFRIYD